MKINPKNKFTLANTFFFGVVGALIGGVIPTLSISASLYDSMMEKTHILFMMYVFWSLAIGFVPASLTGYFYSQAYKKEFLRNGEVKFGKELKMGLEASFLVMLVIALAIALLLFISGLADGSSTTQLSNTFAYSTYLLGLLSICGMIAGCACANLMREWNQKFSNCW